MGVRIDIQPDQAVVGVQKVKPQKGLKGMADKKMPLHRQYPGREAAVFYINIIRKNSC